MANYANLKAAINTVIKQNGQGEITGEVMNLVLTAMVNSLGNGYQFMGVATPSTNPGTPDQNVFYMATQAGTYTNFSAIVLQAGISILLWNGSWSSETFFMIDDVPTAGSNNFVKSGGVQNELALGAVYDVSAKNPTAGVNNDGKWESLSALLSDTNLSTLIPTAWRKGGMSIKFIQSSDNKYVQYRLMSNSWSTDLTDWQGVDDEPIAGSKNLVESGGIANSLLKSQPNGIIKADLIQQDTYIDFNANIGDSVIITYNGTGTNGIRFIAVDDTYAGDFEGSHSSVLYSFTKQIKSVRVTYGDITDVDIQLIKKSNEKLLLSGTYFNGGLEDKVLYDCNINKGSTVYVHLEGQSGNGLSLKKSDNTFVFIEIPQNETSIDTYIVLNEDIIAIRAPYGNLTKCVLSTKEKDWSETIGNIQGTIENIQEDVNESKAYIEGTTASVIADTLVGSVRHPFFAKAGDVISYQFSGSNGVYLQFRDKNDNIVYSITTPSGETQVSGTFVLNSDCKTVNAAFGNLTAVEITKSEAYSAFHESRSNIDYSSILPSGSSKTIELLYLDFESGSINISGINYDFASAIRLGNYKRVIPSTNITMSIAEGYSLRSYFWDNDLSYIGRSDSVIGTTGTITIPNNAGYVKFVITKTSGTLSILGFNSTNTVVTLQNAPKNVPAAPYTVEKQIEELQTYKEQSVIRLTQEDACEGFAITSTPEEFNSVNFALISGIYCHGVKTIKIPLMPNGVGLACIFYDEHGDTVVKRESQTGEEYATKIVEVPENAYAVSFNIRSYKFLKGQHDADPTFDIQSHLLNMELQFPKGVIGENGKRPAVLVDSNGNYPRHYFSPRVCQKPNDFYSEVIDDNDYVENSECTTGVFVLPPNYTPNGKPCPVIMYSHGSSTHIRYKQWGTNANLHNLITYWASLGYAVFDCNGARNTTAAMRGAGCPQNVSAFRKTWEYIKRNYNVEDTVYVIGSSGGGLTAINFCRFTSGVKAFAGLENDVYVVDTWTNQGVDHESFFKYYGFNRLPEGTEYTLANYEESKVGGWDLKKSEFTINNTTMILGFPVPTKVWYGGTGSRWTNFVNYLNNGGTPAFLRAMPGLDHLQICTNSIAVANDVVDWFKINS